MKESSYFRKCSYGEGCVGDNVIQEQQHLIYAPEPGSNVQAV